MKLNRMVLPNLVMVLCLAGTLTVSAQSGGIYSLKWHTFDSGGGKCAGGAFALYGTIGQPETGEELRSDLPTFAGDLNAFEVRDLTGPVYAMRGGFWTGFGRSEIGPRLAIQVDDVDFITLNWPFPSVGFVLQQTANVNVPGGGWANFEGSPIVVVGTNWQASQRGTNAAQMFRLYKPN